MRSGSGNIAFGLVNAPVKMYREPPRPVSLASPRGIASENDKEAVMPDRRPGVKNEKQHVALKDKGMRS